MTRALRLGFLFAFATGVAHADDIRMGLARDLAGLRSAELKAGTDLSTYLILPRAPNLARQALHDHRRSALFAARAGMAPAQEAVTSAVVEQHAGVEIAQVVLNRKYLHPIFGPEGKARSETMLAARPIGGTWKFAPASCLTKDRLIALLRESSVDLSLHPASEPTPR